MMRRAVCLAIAALGLGAPALCQVVGATLGGTVVDAGGALVPGVSISLTNAANGRAQTVVSSERGEYRAVALQPASYRVVAALDGFTPIERQVTLAVGTETTLNFTLTVSGVATTVVVEADAGSASSAEARPSSLVVAGELASLPEIGRNFLVMAQLLPGSGPLNATVTRSATTKFGGVADQRSGFTTQIDGGDIDDAQWGSPTMNLTQEAVQEFKVFRYQFDAQYGKALGAVVSVVTRSGANDVRGSAFYFGRDDSLNATNAFAPTKPPFDEQRLGLSLGGPLIRNRSHVFGAYESDHQDTARIIALSASNPFAGRENGIFPARSDERMAVVKIDHRLSVAHSAFVRYVYDDQDGERSVNSTSDSSQVDLFNRAHSLIGEENWAVSSRLVNTFRAHWFHQTSGGVPHHADRRPAEMRPAVNTGLSVNGDWQTFPRSRLALFDTVYLNAGAHDLKVGGEFDLGWHELDAHFYEDGWFRFRTDAPFNANVPGTWPAQFTWQVPNVQRYEARELALFAQDDWRVGSRLRVNAGLRYDLDPTLRINEFYAAALADPALAGLETFVSGDRGTDTNNIQPRVSASLDLRGNGEFLLRGGWGMYVTRNRPWFQLRSMNQLASPAVLIEDPARLQFYPDVAAILAGSVPHQLGTVIPDDFVQALAQNTSVGIAWQIDGATTLNVDYIHSYGDHQTGSTDRNLPVSGAISVSNPRPEPQFTQVVMVENYTKSWYDALESELRTRFRGGGQLHVSYTLSRTWLDGVDFFLTQRGTQRTPQEQGYGPGDQRHNLTAAAIVPLPFEMQFSAILKLISGSPMLVRAGTDLDGDRSDTGDRPSGLPITVGRDNQDDALRLINDFRAGLTTPLAPVDRALLDLDPFRTLDLRFSKSFRAGRTTRIDLLAEAFNVANHVNIVPTQVNPNMNSAAFLERRLARDARQIQWGVRVSF
jgi:Carboxypeptidase regulatory-like domain